MDEELVEKVARALWKNFVTQYPAALDDDEENWVAHQSDYVSDARAAIQAMMDAGATFSKPQTRREDQCCWSCKFFIMDRDGYQKNCHVGPQIAYKNNGDWCGQWAAKE